LAPYSWWLWGAAVSQQCWLLWTTPASLDSYFYVGMAEGTFYALNSQIYSNRRAVYCVASIFSTSDSRIMTKIFTEILGVCLLTKSSNIYSLMGIIFFKIFHMKESVTSCCLCFLFTIMFFRRAVTEYARDIWGVKTTFESMPESSTSGKEYPKMEECPDY